MEDLKAQAARFGTDIRWGMATRADFSGSVHKVWIDDTHLIEAETVIIATGATAKYLGLEDEQKYAGGGVSACATCDGFFYRGKDVAVVGGEIPLPRKPCIWPASAARFTSSYAAMYCALLK